MLFRKDIDPRCAYCARGSHISDDKVACVKRGIVLPEDRCSAFKYDPLKRVPPRPMKLETAGLIVRCPSKSDRRTTDVRLTEKGRAAAD